MTQSFIKMLHHDMVYLELSSTKVIPPQSYYIVNISFDKPIPEDVCAAVAGDMPCICVFYCVDRLLLFFSKQDQEHQCKGDINIIVSKYTCTATKLLHVHYDNANNVNVTAKLVQFSTNIEVVTYLSWIMHKTFHDTMVRLSKGHITAKDLQFCTDTELQEMLQKHGVKWEECKDWEKYGVLLKIMRKKTKKGGNVQLCETFDSRDTKKYIQFIFD